MTDAIESKIILISCSIFLNEVNALLEEGRLDRPFRFQSSMLHMHPEQLGPRLRALVDQELKKGHQVVLVYGDCAGLMSELEATPGVVRILGKNCIEIFLGKEEYRRLSHEGAFFLLPEWAHRWHHIFSSELGFNQENARSFMRDMHQKLVYLDTGIVSVPKRTLEACSDYCRLPYEVLPISLNHLCHAIDEAIHRVENSTKS